jgi:hypothetical protein
MGKLNSKDVDNAAPRDKEYKLHDGEGLDVVKQFDTLQLSDFF